MTDDVTQRGTTFLVFYKFRSMTRDEKEKSKSEWNVQTSLSNRSY